MKSFLANKSIWFLLTGSVLLNIFVNQEILSVPSMSNLLPLPGVSVCKPETGSKSDESWNIQAGANEAAMPSERNIENGEQQQDHFGDGDWIAISN